MADITKQKNIGDYDTTSVTDTIQVVSYEPGAAKGNRTKRLPFAAAVNAVIDQPESSSLQMGWYDYNDLATQTTPISIAVAGTEYTLTNDTLGPYTGINIRPLSDVTTIWNPVTNRFDFSGLAIGDTVDIRLDVVAITTTPNQSVSVSMVLGEGTASEYTIPLINSQQFKTAGSHQLFRFSGMYIGSADVRDGPAKLVISSDDVGSAIVNGWWCRVIK